MKKIDQIKNIIIQHKDELRDKYKILEIGIFGSYIRGKRKRKSDIDILVRFDEPVSLLQWVSAENYLSDLLEIKVDMVPKEDVRQNSKKES